MSGPSLEHLLVSIASAAEEIPAADAARLAQLKIELLGRKAGRVTELLRELPKLDPAARRDIGGRANKLKQEIEAAIEQREQQLARETGRADAIDPSMPGRATQCGSRAGSAASATRPWASSTRTRLALHGLQMPGVASSTRAKRGSRTVKYWAPLSKRPKGVTSLAMRPPTPAPRSNTVTRWPACTRVRAQATPAMPAPTTAK